MAILILLFSFNGIAAAGDSIKFNPEMSPYCTTTPPKGINPDFYRWPKSNIDAYHGNPDIYYKKKMLYCHGNTAETSQIIYVTPTWPYHIREDWDYPLTVVDTVGGVLVARGSTSATGLFLDGKLFIDDYLTITIDEAFSEENGKPEIVIFTGEAGLRLPTFPEGRRIIDFSVSPPFISHDTLDIGGLSSLHTRVPHSALKESFVSSDIGIKIRKIDAYTFEFSGPSWDREPVETIYRYTRKDRTVTRIK